MLSVSTQVSQEDSLTLFESMLKSISFADELVVFNLGRDDDVAHALFQKYATRIINVKTPKVVEEIRTRQVQECRGDWVLIMDYDEIIPPPLQKEIQSKISSPQSNISAYSLSRENFSLGYPLHHGGWERDYVVRLLRRADFLAWPQEIHSLPQFKGELGKLTHAMEHHKDASLEQMVTKTNRYSDIEASQFFVGHLPPVNGLTLIRKWWMESFRRAILKGGILDPKIGLIQSIYQGFSVFISYAKLYEKQKNRL